MRINLLVRFGLMIGSSGVAFAIITTDLRAGDETRASYSASTSKAPADLPRLFFVTPGTPIENAPPPGWSHLVLKSFPKLASGDLDTLPESAKSTATMFHTVILADVRKNVGEGAGFSLRRIGLGICVPVKGHDLVVNSDRLQALDVRLSTIPKIVLGRTESEMAQGRLVARTPTCAILRSPVMLLVGGEHRRVLLNYAFLVDPETGALSTWVWWIDSAPETRKPARELVLLQPAPLVETCNMDVSAQRLLGEIPVSWSFAMSAMPVGKTYAMPSRLQAWSVYDPKSVAESAALERDLRSAWTAAQARSTARAGALSHAAGRPD